MSIDGGLYKLDFSPNPLQKSFIESRAMADLFSSRMGEGKSAGLVWAVFYHTMHNPGARWALVRDTWENMRDTTQKEFFKWFPPGICGTYAVSAKTFTWAIDGLGGGEVMFMGMDDPADASKLQSRELAGIGFDEPAPAQGTAGIDELIFDMGMSRLRQPGIKWYACKSVENNPDEAHWSYAKFVNPGTEGFALWQPVTPENLAHLPSNYYDKLRSVWRNRPDLVRRFVEGKFGFQQVGEAVTPEWADDIHLTLGLGPVKGSELLLCWDGGLHPACVITQVTNLGEWRILEAVYGEEIGIYELIRDGVAPLLKRRYRNIPLRHTGDPTLATPDQSSANQSALRVLKKELQGTWIPGPIKLTDRINPLRSILSKTRSGRGLVQVDREAAKAVWHALRGGWHYHVARTGIVSGEPVKNHPHSDIGDCMAYGAAYLFPAGDKRSERRGWASPPPASYGGARLGGSSGLIERSGILGPR